MDYQEKQHQKVVEGLVKRLLDKPYDAVLMNSIYHVGDLIGELDVLAIRKNVCHYYECKVRDSYSQRRHAGEQINRVKRAFPHWEVRGIYFTGDGKIRRFK